MNGLRLCLHCWYPFQNPDTVISALCAFKYFLLIKLLAWFEEFAKNDKRVTGDREGEGHIKMKLQCRK